MTGPTDEAGIDRRTMLTTAAGGLAVGLAGCMGGNGADRPAAVALDEGQTCDQCGMVIEEHPGPTGQVFFEDHLSDRDGPAWFCSGTCTYTYRSDQEAEGATPIVTYLTDYSAVDYSIEGDQPAITAHLAAEDYVVESALSVVAGSEVIGAMGPDLIPFSDTADADAFAEEYGGEVLPATDVDRELVDSIKS
ncbi:nitrous oxide reductase accessory protein NosL [Halohasta salina]|uniref:nitrous oxide reductase accessory protein NosL n=1 Tax=Halohasta salina TaxID=2961621 RepID=UPI0020A4BE72|nr:nitrous oxide reductase accessory protein NosL [Halohasta salina]